MLNKSNLKEPGGPGSKILFAETVLAKIFQTKYYDQDCTLIHKINTTQNKIPDTSGLVTTTVLNIKLNEVENKIPNPDKYIATRRFNKLTTELFAAALKWADLVTKIDFDNELTSFNRRITPNKTKYLEVQKELNSLITNGYNFFLDKIYFTSNDGSQNTFDHQPTLHNLELNKVKGTDYVLNWKSNGVYNFKLKLLYTIVLHSIKLFGYRMRRKFDEDPLAVEQSNYLTKLANFFIVYEFNAWPRSPTNNFAFTNCLSGATNVVKNSDKEKCVYSGYGITFDSAGF